MRVPKPMRHNHHGWYEGWGGGGKVPKPLWPWIGLELGVKFVRKLQKLRAEHKGGRHGRRRLRDESHSLLLRPPGGSISTSSRDHTLILGSTTAIVAILLPPLLLRLHYSTPTAPAATTTATYYSYEFIEEISTAHLLLPWIFVWQKNTGFNCRRKSKHVQDRHLHM